MMMMMMMGTPNLNAYISGIVERKRSASLLEVASVASLLEGVEEEGCNEDYVFKCCCYRTSETGLMAACDDCDVWSHAHCNGYEELTDNDAYLCGFCLVAKENTNCKPICCNGEGKDKEAFLVCRSCRGIAHPGCIGGLGLDPSDSPGPFTCNKCSKDANPEVSVFKTVKCSLKSVVKDDISIEKLQDAASRSSQIMTHGLHLLKLYLIHCFDNDLPLPRLDRKFVHSAMMVCCESTGRGGRLGEATAEIRCTLKGFAEEHYPVEKVSAYNLSAPMDYMADDVVTMYERNIQQQYEGYLQRYVDILTGE